MTAEAMTYSSLVQDVKDYAERNDAPFIAQIPRFIMLAENRIASTARGLGYTRIVTGTVTAADSVIEKPARWRETALLYVNYDGKNKFLRSRSYAFCRTAFSPFYQGEPEYYADYGYEHLLIAPKPVEEFSFEMTYYERPLPLSDENQTSWTTRYAPQLLLYGALLEAQPFLKRPERTAEFQGLYAQAKDDLERESQRRLTGDQALLSTNG